MSDYVEKKFAASAIEVNYAEGPDNGPPLVLIHGLSGYWADWEPVIDQFSANWHVNALDLRGHGGSGRVPGGYAFDKYSVEVIEFLQGVVGQPAFIVGHSLGGVTAGVLGAAAPELVRAVALEDPPIYTNEWFDESPFAPSFQAAMDIRNKSLGMTDTAIEIRKIDDVSSDEQIVMRAIAITKTDPEVWKVVLEGREAESLNPDDVLSAITAPVLLMQGNPDMGGALRDVEASRAVELMKQGRYVKWDDVGHHMHSAEPERFVQLVNAFFRQVQRKG
ncbi:MAG TPA: alpha/beta hydrolase [Dehalococcoidia bacterium]|jgi:pimeloyl-ACP methyl ester carboxylesterase|nr:alpha/beta hydrolase [Dehalococcoidia bacterium]HIK88209.1 alpha/beta hydrolase [Dehalococcoidia bacterium]